MARNDLTPESLVAIIEDRERKSYGLNDSQLVADRAEALRYYNGDPFGNEVEGRSSVVSRDTLDVIESALPQLLKIFVSGDEIVRFDPRGPEDEKAAEQETAAVNYFTLEKNDGFAIFYTWFKDALLSKNGYCKVWYEENEEVETESYQGLTDEQLTMLMQDEKVEVLEHTQYPDTIDLQQRQMAIQQNPQAAEQIMAMPEKFLHDVKIQVKEVRGCIEIANVAPEDILVGYDTRSVSLQEATFVQHRALMTMEEMEEQGWDVPENLDSYQDQSRWEEENARSQYLEDSTTIDDLYLVKDTYICLDGELQRVVLVGQTIVHQEDAEIIPFACITPHIMPHRHVGMSYADLTKDIQLIKSTLLRGQLDNMYLANNGRTAISDKVNLDDMLTSRPGGVVRVEGVPSAEIMQLQSLPPPPTSFSLIEYLDSAKEKRTGVTAYNQGLDANSLNKTATGVNQIMQAAQQRLELVARTFANTGVKELFILVHRMVRKYYTRPEIIRLKGEWIPVDPREWKERKDMSVTVGLGTGNKDQQLLHLSNLFQQQMMLLQGGLPVVTPDNIFNTMRQMAINAGFKQPEMFVTDPKMIPPQPPREDPMMAVEKMKLQADQQKFQAQAQIDQQKAQADLQQEQLRSSNDVQIERQKIGAQMELERYKAEMDAQVALEKARIDAQAKLEIEQIKAANQPAPAQVSVNNDTNGTFANGLQEMMQRQEEGLKAIIETLSRPKQIVRGPDGRAVGVQ